MPLAHYFGTTVIGFETASVPMAFSGFFPPIRKMLKPGNLPIVDSIWSRSARKSSTRSNVFSTNTIWPKMHQCKNIKQISSTKWITTVQLPVVDRIEVDMNIESWKVYDKQIIDVEVELVKRSETRAADMFRKSLQATKTCSSMWLSIRAIMAMWTIATLDAG